MVYSDDCQEEDTNVLGVDLIFFECLVSLMHKSTLQTVFAFLFYSCEAHLLQNLVKEHIFNFGLCGRRHAKPLHHPKILLDELLCHILFIVQVQLPLLLACCSA